MNSVRSSNKKVTDNKISKDGPMVYCVETPTALYWSASKMTAQYRHVDFLWRDKARWKEFSEFKFKQYTKKLSKEVLEIKE